jgi:prolyl-tRNA synthetase
MGALIMGHSDDNGLVIPPRLAPLQVVIIPIYKSQDELEQISKIALDIKKTLEENQVSVKYDDRDTHKPGWKFTDYELKGVPVRLAIGPRDILNHTVEIARRDTREKWSAPQENIVGRIKELLDDIQNSLFRKALEFRNQNTFRTDDYQEFKDIIMNRGGFVMAHWDGTTETENKIKEETKATIRCIPLDPDPEKGKCIYTGKPSDQRVLFAKAY